MMCAFGSVETRLTIGRSSLLGNIELIGWIENVDCKRAYSSFVAAVVLV